MRGGAARRARPDVGKSGQRHFRRRAAQEPGGFAGRRLRGVQHGASGHWRRADLRGRARTKHDRRGAGKEFCAQPRGCGADPFGHEQRLPFDAARDADRDGGGRRLARPLARRDRDSGSGARARIAARAAGRRRHHHAQRERSADAARPGRDDDCVE